MNRVLPVSGALKVFGGIENVLLIVLPMYIITKNFRNTFAHLPGTGFCGSTKIYKSRVN